MRRWLGGSYREISAALALTASASLAAVVAFSRFRRQRSNGDTSKSAASWECVREKLPKDLEAWRMFGDGGTEREDKLWELLDDVLVRAGLTRWLYSIACMVQSPGCTYPISSGFGYGTANQEGEYDNVVQLRRYECANPLTRPARTRDGHDVVVRVLCLGDQGQNHLQILRKLTTGREGLYFNNHTLPLFQEIHHEDIVFGLFPKAQGHIEDIYGWWAKNSVGDIMDMLMQALEALAFIHSRDIAHRDAFKDNFLIQWHPQSMRTMTISPTRPRIYLTDFESAIDLSTLPERTCVGYPTGDSFGIDGYARPPAPEMITGKPYCPFKLDVWQLGVSFSDMKTSIPEIDEFLESFWTADNEQRVGSEEALRKLQDIVQSMPPKSLLIEPIRTRRTYLRPDDDE